MNERFDKYTNEYMHFERIENPLHPDPFICGLMKLYELHTNKCSHCAEHDIIYVANLDDLKELSDEDIIYLLRCGFHYDEETNSIVEFC